MPQTGGGDRTRPRLTRRNRARRAGFTIRSMGEDDMRVAFLICAGGLALAGCNEDRSVETGAPVAGGAKAVAMLRTAAGAEVGRATAT